MSNSILKFSFVFTLLLASLIGYSQVVQDDFEGNGTIDSWVGDNCQLELNVPNPYSTDGNSSARVLSYHDLGGQYANVRFQTAQNFDISSISTFSLKVYVPNSGLTGNQNPQISLKLQNGDLPEPWVTQTEVIKDIALDQWQTVTFNFRTDNYRNLEPNSPPPVERDDLNRVIIQLNGENNNDQVKAYIDDVVYDNIVTTDPIYNKLIWSDEFNEDGPINPDNWFAQTKIPNGQSWFNGEIQHYTDRTDNAFVEDGLLKIVAKKETFTDQGVTKEYTSARLNSKFAFKYGRVVIRAKLPSGSGTWPALWMLGKNINEDGAYWQTQGFGTTGWPACGEIDIMEHWGTNQNFVQSAMHTPSSHGNTIDKGGQFIGNASTGFNDYEMVWSPDQIVFSINGSIHYTYAPENKNTETWPFDAEQYFIFNIAIQSVIASSFIGSNMEIDYVRVYGEGTSNIDEPKQITASKIYPVPFSNQLHVSLDESINTRAKTQLFSVDGRLLYNNTTSIVEGNLHLTKIDNLPSGLYTLIISTESQSWVAKVVRE